MTTFGIDAMSFFTSNAYLDLATMAKVRNTDVNKYYVGIGQRLMGVPSVDEDIVTMAANAADKIINDQNRSQIKTIIFATESGVDQSKAAAVYLQTLLQLPNNCRAIELKQACYASTAGLHMGLGLLHRHPEQKVLLVASDIARYGLNTPAEPTQGCGAVAMVLSANPHLLSLENDTGCYTQDVMDFWRPNYSEEAFVEGKFSSKMYLALLEHTWRDYHEKSKQQFEDHAHFCFHTPVSRLAEKGYALLARLNNNTLSDAECHDKMQDVLRYGRQIGNSYTASLFISFMSLLDHAKEDLAGKRIGFYGYGSGCVAELYSGVLMKDYKKQLHTEQHQALINNRNNLSYEQYETRYNYKLPTNGGKIVLPKQQTGKFRLAGIANHKRQYELA
ncbi:MAG: hydroxymethylglutaryl-CoA synthase [Gammaproteobacteria bacterium]